MRRQQRVQLGREESRRRLSSGPGKEFISPDLRNGSPGRRDRERSKSIDRVRGKSKDRDRSPSNERPEEKELIEANGNRYDISLNVNAISRKGEGGGEQRFCSTSSIGNEF